jgi:predicted RNA-binding Zn-ribbon protein involved in translation (DUF1610 family)
MSVDHGHLGECLACGYDLAGSSVGDSCPECGAVVIANPFRGGWRDAKVRRRFVRGSRCMVAATTLLGASLAMVLLASVTPLGWFPVVMSVANAVAFCGVAMLAVSMVLLAFVWRAIVAARVLVTLIALLLASFVGIPRIAPSITIESAGAFWSLLGAAIALSPGYLARSSGRAMRFRWLPLVSFGALVAVAIMALTFEEVVIALVMVSQLGTAAAFCALQRSIAVALRDPKETMIGGGWSDAQARRRLVIGAGVFVCASAINAIQRGLGIDDAISGVDAFWFSGSYLAFQVSVLVAIIALGLAARRIAVVWLLVFALTIRLLSEVAMAYIPPSVVLSGTSEIYRFLAFAQMIAAIGCCMLPLVIARSAGRPRSLPLWCACVLGALGSGLAGLADASPELLLVVDGLIRMIPGVSGFDVFTPSGIVGAACTTLAYLLLAREIRGAWR